MGLACLAARVLVLYVVSDLIGNRSHINEWIYMDYLLLLLYEHTFFLPFVLICSSRLFIPYD